MCNWLKNLFRRKKQGNETVKDATDQTISEAPASLEGEEKNNHSEEQR